MSTQSSRLLSITLASICALASTPSFAARRAAPKARVAVLDVQGPGGAAVRDAVARALSGAATLVPKQELTLAARLVDVKSPLGVSKLLASVDATLAVQVAISGRGARASAALQVFSRDGRRLAKWTGAGPSARGGAQGIARAATSAVRDALDRLAVEEKAALAEKPAEPRYETRPLNLVRPTLADAWSEPEKKRGWGEPAQGNAAATQVAAQGAAQVAGTQSATQVAVVESVTQVASVQGATQVAAVPGATQVAAAQGATQVAAARSGRPIFGDVAQSASEPAVEAHTPARVVPKDEVEEAPARSFASVMSGAADAGQGSSSLGSSSLGSSPQGSSTLASSSLGSSSLGARRPVGRAVVVPKDELVEGPRDARTVAALAGVTVRQRVAAIALDDGRLAKHDSGVFPEVTLFARTQPFSQTRSALNGMFADVEAAFAVGLSSAFEDERVGTSALRLSFGTGWCWESGVLSLGGSLGFGLERFALAENDVMGSSSYTFVRPGLLARVAIAGEALTLEGTAGYRAVMSTGEVGAPFAQLASANGVDVSARIAGTIDADLAISWALVGGWSRYGLTFADRRGVAAGPAALDGSDTSLTGTAVLGIALR